MTPSRADTLARHRIVQGDCVAHLRTLDANSVDSIVTDPPYAIDARGDTDRELSARGMLGMQSANWNEKATHSRGYADNTPAVFQQWCTAWLAECERVLKPGGHLVAFGGTRTWHRLATAAEDCGFEIRDSIAWIHGTGRPKTEDLARSASRAAPEKVGEVRGWSTMLNPVYEPAILARKPIEDTVLQNVLQHGVGALNIDGTRIADQNGKGRWPSNMVLDANLVPDFDEGFPQSVSVAIRVAKPDSNERVRVDGIGHPTVKPLELMRFLVRMVTPPGGLVLDPFAGSGTTAEAAILEDLRSLSVEREPCYVAMIEQRIARRLDPQSLIHAEDDNVLTLPFG